MVSATTGIITTVAGTLNNPTPGFAGDGGPATGALLSVPSGISVDGDGNLFIADSNNNAVRVVYAGGAQLAALIALEIPGTTAVPGNIYTIAGGPANTGLPLNGDGGLASLGNLNSPAAVVTDSNGNVYIADFGNVAVRRVDAVSGDIGTVYQGVDGPTNLSVDASDDIYFTGHTFCTISQYHTNRLGCTLLNDRGWQRYLHCVRRWQRGHVRRPERG
jgi:streptogramin lyase